MRKQLPNLSAAVQDAEKLAECLKANGLIGASTIDAILEENSVRASRVRKMFSFIHNSLTVEVPGIDPRETLRVLCENVLKKQDQTELDAIADQMLIELCT